MSVVVREVLYLIVCASPRARRVGELVTLARQDGWDAHVIATPQALNFIDADGLADASGHPVRSRYRHPDEPDDLPPADAILACPITFNSINKWAAGISDTLALGLLTEGVGRGVRLVAAPALNSAQAAHPAFRRSVGELRGMGVTVLYGPGVYEPAPPGTGGRPYPWRTVLDALREKRAPEAR
jgi:phosphopantothenoylcysteine synthetase/decarboxylase